MINLKELKSVFSDNLLLDTPYFEGDVVNNADPEGYNRIRVQVKGLTISEDEQTFIPEDKLPWLPIKFGVKSGANSSGSIPNIGARVLVHYPTDDIYHGIVIGTIQSKAPTGL